MIYTYYCTYCGIGIFEFFTSIGESKVCWPCYHRLPTYIKFIHESQMPDIPPDLEI